MKHKNLSDYKIKKILTFFCADIVASKTAGLLGLNRKTVDVYYCYFRQVILVSSLMSSKKLKGVVEVGFLYHCAKKDRAFIGMVDDSGRLLIETLGAVSFAKFIEKYIEFGSMIFTPVNFYDDGLSYCRYKHCALGNKNAELLFNVHCSLNRINSVSSYCKRRLDHFNGSVGNDYRFFFKECEMRFNCGSTEAFYNKMVIELKKHSKYVFGVSRRRKDLYSAREGIN